MVMRQRGTIIVAVLTMLIVMVGSCIVIDANNYEAVNTRDIGEYMQL